MSHGSSLSDWQGVYGHVHSHAGGQQAHYHEVRMEDDPRFHTVMLGCVACILFLLCMNVVQCFVICNQRKRRQEDVKPKKVEVRSSAVSDPQMTCRGLTETEAAEEEKEQIEKIEMVFQEVKQKGDRERQVPVPLSANSQQNTPSNRQQQSDNKSTEAPCVEEQHASRIIEVSVNRVEEQSVGESSSGNITESR